MAVPLAMAIKYAERNSQNGFTLSSLPDVSSCRIVDLFLDCIGYISVGDPGEKPPTQRHVTNPIVLQFTSRTAFREQMENTWGCTLPYYLRVGTALS